MPASIYVFDPTVNDPLSKVRGVGRYLQILKENFPENTIFTGDLSTINNQQLAIFINPFFNFLQYPLTMRRIAKKQIAVIHDLITLKYPEYFPVGIKGKLNIFLNKLALRNYDLIVTDSEASKSDILHMLKVEENRVRVIYPCLPKIFTQSKSEIRNPKSETNSKSNNDSGVVAFAPPQNDVILASDEGARPESISSFDIRASNFCLYVGDATWNKNLANLAKAIKIINVTCVFVGKVFDRKYQKSKIKNQNDKSKIKNNNISMKQYDNETMKDNLLNHPWGREFVQFLKETDNDKRFVFLGYVSDKELIQLYQQARCNVLVSHDEGFGFSYLEAASQSCPSVLSDIEILREISNNQGTIFTKPGDQNNIANAIGEVYFNRDLRDKYGATAKERVKYFSQKRFVNEFLKIFKF